jgi:hypothetical protein
LAGEDGGAAVGRRPFLLRRRKLFRERREKETERLVREKKVVK